MDSTVLWTRRSFPSSEIVNSVAFAPSESSGIEGVSTIRGGIGPINEHIGRLSGS